MTKSTCFLFLSAYIVSGCSSEKISLEPYKLATELHCECIRTLPTLKHSDSCAIFKTAVTKESSAVWKKINELDKNEEEYRNMLDEIEKVKIAYFECQIDAMNLVNQRESEINRLEYYKIPGQDSLALPLE